MKSKGRDGLANESCHLPEMPHSYLEPLIREKTSRLTAPAEDVDAPNGLHACCADTTFNDSNIWKTAFHSDNLDFTDKQ